VADRRSIEDQTTAARGEPGRVAGTKLAAGDVLGKRWKLEEFLASGGMGSVWRALDLRLDEAVAVKLTDTALCQDDESGERFLREARAAAQLRGSNVVSILDYDVDIHSRTPYMVMELLDGEDLAERLTRGPLGYLETLSVVADICTAMTRAHRRGIVHRDLKPANVFLAREDDETITKVLDFGIAKFALDALSGKHGLTKTGSTLGTLYYMSPEQVRSSSEVDYHCDLWSIGVLTFECLTGRRAFDRDNVPAVMHAICNEDAPVPSRIGTVPAGFDEWFATATARDPSQRFQSARELVAALRDLGGAPRPVEEPAAASRPPPRQTWASDANQIDIGLLADVTFKNAVVEEFLTEDAKHFVAGAKGQGKTLLLTYKRSLLSARYHETEKKKHAVQFVPEGRPYLDLMGDLRTPAQGHVDFMASLSNCKRMWGFALRVSALSHHPTLIGPEDADDLARLPKRLRATLEGKQAEPTMVAKELLALSVGQINRTIDDAENFLEHKIRSLHSGMFVFIDKLDQALRRLSRDAWVSMQAGLIEAAWDLMNTNRHIKVFATIREEAFSSYESDIKSNLYGATTTLRYTKGDLEKMLEKMTHFYEGIPLQDFVRPDEAATRTDAREDAFDFIYRHTLGRPRDLVIIGSEISRQRDAMDERVFKRVVREASSGIVVGNVFDEMRVFLDVLADKAQRMRFFSLLPYGVLTYEEMVAIWCRMHGVEREYFDTYGRESADVYHPFRELYDCGVLGIIARDGDAAWQRFKQPQDAVDGLHHEVPRSPFYVLHPALQALILRLGTGDGYRAYRHVVVGHDLPWPAHYPTLLEAQRALFSIPGTDHSEEEQLLTDLLGVFDRRVSTGEDAPTVRAELAASPPMKRLLSQLDARGWDELHLMMLELFPNDLV